MIPFDVTYNYLILSGDHSDISQSILLISVNELCHFLYQCAVGGHDCFSNRLLVNGLNPIDFEINLTVSKEKVAI